MTQRKEDKKMKTMQAYWNDRIAGTTFEEMDSILEFEEQLYQTWQDDDIDLERWCEDNGIDYWATDDNGILFVTRWAWDMCGE